MCIRSVKINHSVEGYTGSYQIPVFIFMIYIFNIPQYNSMSLKQCLKHGVVPFHCASVLLSGMVKQPSTMQINHLHMRLNDV